MPTVSQVIKFRNQKRLKHQHNPLLSVGLIFSLLFSLLGAIGSLIGLWVYADITRDLPSLEVLPSLLEPPDGTSRQPTRLYDRNNEHVILTLENPSVAGRQYLFVGKSRQAEKALFPENLIHATIAQFDPGFWKHPGYILDGLSVGTHPTLAQKLISNLVLDSEPHSLKRNIRERILAAQITARFGREKILEWYLNSAQYGELIYGADAAAHAFFGKSATGLSLAESAMLTAIAETPLMNPLTQTQLLKGQQEKILLAMVGNRMITLKDAEEALNEKITLRAPSRIQSIAPAFTELVLMQLSSEIPLERIRHGGYVIVTSLDYDLQLEADCATKAQIARFKGVQEQPVDSGGSACDAAQFLPTLQPSEAGQENRLDDLSANVVILDPQSGQILAMVGETGSETGKSFTAKHPAGTILSPFIYLTAFTRGMSPASLHWDIPTSIANGDAGLGLAASVSANSENYHGPVRLRTALVNDYSTVSADIAQEVGVENVFLTEKRFGIDLSEVNLNTEATIDDLFSQSITLLEGVYAYGILANQGVMAGHLNNEGTTTADPESLSPTGVLRVMGLDGRIWLDWSTAQTRTIITSQLAYLTTNVLSDETARWASLGHPNSLEIRRPTAAKVGRTVDNNDTWAVGYIPQLAIGVWMGHSQEEQGGISVELPAGLWHAIIEYASSMLPVKNFNIPDGIKQLQVCDPSGMLVSTLCPSIVQEVFLSGYEPTQVDNLYQKFYLNRETGLLATAFTPSDVLEEKVFLVVPPQAENWANEAGFPIPPDTYDAIDAPINTSQDVQMTNPQMFDHLRGKVNITGRAAGNDFLYYRLQVGEGLNPQQWTQIGEDINHPVNDGKLGSWDTNGLEGLYIVQLLVVREGQRVDRAILQVTVDNTLPLIQILAPADAEEIVFKQGESLMIQVATSDNLELERVEFYLDAAPESTLHRSPWTILWPTKLGEHTLLVKAFDLAGNVRESTISFSVHK